jgi:hypothetical protein
MSQTDDGEMVNVLWRVRREPSPRSAISEVQRGIVGSFWAVRNGTTCDRRVEMDRKSLRH